MLASVWHGCACLFCCACHRALIFHWSTALLCSHHSLYEATAFALISLLCFFNYTTLSCLNLTALHCGYCAVATPAFQSHSGLEHGATLLCYHFLVIHWRSNQPTRIRFYTLAENLQPEFAGHPLPHPQSFGTLSHSLHQAPSLQGVMNAISPALRSLAETIEDMYHFHRGCLSCA